MKFYDTRKQKNIWVCDRAQTGRRQYSLEQCTLCRTGGLSVRPLQRGIPQGQILTNGTFINVVYWGHFFDNPLITQILRHRYIWISEYIGDKDRDVLIFDLYTSSYVIMSYSLELLHLNIPCHSLHRCLVFIGRMKINGNLLYQRKYFLSKIMYILDYVIFKLNGLLIS